MENAFSIFHFQFFITLVCLLLALFLSFSRSAWIAAFIIICVAAHAAVPRKIFRPLLVSSAAIIAILGVAVSLVAPQLLLRRTSTWGHLVRPLQAMQEMRRYPLGFGLGAAGPAANRTHDPCVFLEPGADPSWAKNSPNLCVFVGDIQVQPGTKACDCAMLPENWYLQIGVELGVAGFLLYVGLVLLVLRRLGMENGKWKMENGVSIFNFQFSILLVFLSLSLAALFLHAWEDSAVAYTAWVLVAVVLSRQHVIRYEA